MARGDEMVPLSLWLQQLTADRSRILIVGPDSARLVAQAKRLDPSRTVYAINSAAVAGLEFGSDRVKWLRQVAHDVPFEAGSIDCVLYSDGLNCVCDPQLLLHHRRA